MSRMIEERRQVIIDSAIQIAADRGLEYVNLRAAAHAVGISWESAHKIFGDHADLLTAIGQTVMSNNVSADMLDLTTEEGALSDLLEVILLRLWDQLSADRDRQLISYEFSVLALRRTALRGMVAAQYDSQRELATSLSAKIADHHGFTWNRPVEEVGRFSSAFFDGVTLSWLVDGNDVEARAEVVRFAQVLASFVDDAGQNLN